MERCVYVFFPFYFWFVYLFVFFFCNCLVLVVFLVVFFLLKDGILVGYNSTGQINEKIPCRCLILTQVNCSKKERGDIK